MHIVDWLIAFIAFCLALTTYGVVMLLRAWNAWREWRVRTAMGTPHPRGESRRRLIGATVLGALTVLLGGVLVALVGPTINPGTSFAGYRMATALGLLGVGVASVIVGWRWDRAKGRRRCPKCWYSYEGLAATAACPECGRVGKSERDLLRTRRKPAMYLMFPAMMAAAWYAFIAPGALSWRSYIPTTVMIGGYDWMPESVLVSPRFTSVDSLEERIVASQLTATQRDWVRSRAVHAAMTRERPEEVAAACRLLLALAIPGASTEGFDLIGMRALAMLSKCKPHGGNLPSSDLFDFAVRYARSETPIDGEDLDNVLRWTKRTTLDLNGRNILLMRLAPRRADVIEAIRAELNAGSHTVTEGAADAALVLGDLIRDDPVHRASIERDFRSSQYVARLNYGRVVLASRFERVDLNAAPHEVNRVSARNASLVAELLTGGDADLAEISLMFPWQRLGYYIDDAELTRRVSELAATDASRRGNAISYLCNRRALCERDIPTLIAYLDENPASAGLIALSLDHTPMSSSWLELREPLRTADRRRNPSFRSPQADPVSTLLARLDQIASEETLDAPSGTRSPASAAPPNR